LVSFEIGAERKQHWSRLLSEMPEVPTRRIKGLDLLAAGEKYAPGREICESPEMYSVYPFRQAWLGNAALLASARQSLHLRTVSLDGTADGQAVETGGWQSAPVQAAYLGLAREAARLTSINFNDQFVHWTDNVDPKAPWPARPRARFPAFWETKMDYTPDNDHGANSVNALQSLLLQSDGKKIYLLPAWPEDWDVSFKLHAAFNTTVECEYRDGKVKSLKVTPASRRSDVIDLSSQPNRVRALVSAACADRNYLFDLPPMLDGCAIPDDMKRLKTTGPWLAKYGESLYDTKIGPFAPGQWGGSVFKGTAVFVHVLDWPADKLQLPAISRKLVSTKCLTGGKAEVVQTPEGITVSTDQRNRNSIDTIIKLDFDGPIEPIALSAPYAGSLTTGKTATAESFKAGFEPGNAFDSDTKTMWASAKTDGPSWLEVDLGEPRTFDRVEIQIDNPGHKRGQAKGFKVQFKQADASWATCCEGAVFGSIYGKRFNRVTARFVRLSIAAPGVKQFDLFPPTKDE
ncbi:MAG: discoidin domain-containing protein, partial [Verrucomicrobia bacterium]|nr:discoidin domain-containing protein [Verrucomicrobiota bacterium]